MPKIVKGGLSSIFNLRLLNLFIGLAKGAKGLPPIIRELGYGVEWIESRFRNSLDEEVVPELILSSVPKAHSLLFEWKKGANLEKDQLDHYSHVTSEDLRAKVMLPAPSYEHFDVTYVVKGEHVERVLIGLASGPYPFPVLIVADGKILLRANSFDCQELNQVFGPGLEVDWDLAPMSYVPFDRESPLELFGEKVIPAVIARMAQREPRINLEMVAEDVVPQWRVIDDKYRKDLRSKIFEVLRQASLYEFSDYLNYNKDLKQKFGPTWDITSNPLDLRTDKRHTAYKKLETLQRRFLEALRTGRRAEEQLALFPDLGKKEKE